MTNEQAIKKLEGLKYALISYELERGGCTEEIKAVKMGIEALKQTMWVPVSERLPEEDGLYLITEKSGRVGMYTFHNQGNSKEYWRRCALAWMPLPKPYKESEE